MTYKLDYANVNYSTGTTVSGYSDDSQSTLVSNAEVKATLIEEVVDGTTQYILDSDNPMKLPLAGTYKVDKVSFKIGNSSFSTSVSDSEKGSVTEVSIITEKAPSYTYEWQAPVVKITGVDPINVVANIKNDSFSFAIWDWGQKLTKSSLVNTYSDYVATVYYNVASTNSKGNKVESYELPKVAMELSNISTSFKEAGMTINPTGTTDGVAVSGKKPNTVNISFSSSTKNETGYGTEVTIGEVGSNIATNRYVVGMGAQGTHITVTGTINGATITYTFQLVNPITINNPY